MNWHPFNQTAGSDQELPPLRKWVALEIAPPPPEPVDLGFKVKDGIGLVANYPPGYAIGYRKDAAGDPESPYFVIPQFGGRVVSWCDCLPEDFNPPRR